MQVVLFDLGGVLIELGGVASMRELTGIDSDDELWRRWLGCPWVRRFESGQCSADEFAAGVVADWQLTVAPQVFLDAFEAWPVGPFPGAHRAGPVRAALGPDGLSEQHQRLAQ